MDLDKRSLGLIHLRKDIHKSMSIRCWHGKIKAMEVLSANSRRQSNGKLRWLEMTRIWFKPGSLAEVKSFSAKADEFTSSGNDYLNRISFHEKRSEALCADRTAEGFRQPPLSGLGVLSFGFISGHSLIFQLTNQSGDTATQRSAVLLPFFVPAKMTVFVFNQEDRCVRHMALLRPQFCLFREALVLVWDSSYFWLRYLHPEIIGQFVEL